MFDLLAHMGNQNLHLLGTVSGCGSTVPKPRSRGFLFLNDGLCSAALADPQHSRTSDGACFAAYPFRFLPTFLRVMIKGLEYFFGVRVF